MLAYLEGNVGPSWGYVGLSWKLCGPILRPMWTHVEPKEPKNGTAKNHCKTQDILTVGGLSWGYVGPSWGLCCPSLRAMWAHVGAMLAHLGAMLAHLGAMMAHLGAILAHLGRYVGPSWGYVGPSCGLCWPMLTHLEPQDPKNGKKSEEHKTP